MIDVGPAFHTIVPMCHELASKLSKTWVELV